MEARPLSFEYPAQTHLAGHVHGFADQGGAKDKVHGGRHLIFVADQAQCQIHIGRTNLLLGLLHHLVRHCASADLVEGNDGDAALQLAVG